MCRPRFVTQSLSALCEADGQLFLGVIPIRKIGKYIGICIHVYMYVYIYIHIQYNIMQYNETQ